MKEFFTVKNNKLPSLTELTDVKPDDRGKVKAQIHIYGDTPIEFNKDHQCIVPNGKYNLKKISTTRFVATRIQ